MTKQGHILFSYSFDHDGKATKLDNEKVAEELKNDGLAWVHLDANFKSAKKWLQSEVHYLDHLIIDALLAEETRPRIMEFDSGLLLILRGISAENPNEPEDMASIRIWVDSQRIITIQRRNMKAISDLCEQVASGQSIKNSGEFLYNLISQILSITSPILYTMIEKIDDLEEKILNTHDIKLREEILQLRTQSAIFKRFFVPQREAISKLRTTIHPCIDEWAKRHFQENFDQISHMIEEVDEAINRSQILHDELANALTEKLNKNMFKLSLITVIFMPLTFVTGLFGMNVGGIPGADNNLAFYTCVSLMMLVAAMQILFFKKKDWF